MHAGNPFRSKLQAALVPICAPALYIGWDNMDLNDPQYYETEDSPGEAGTPRDTHEEEAVMDEDVIENPESPPGPVVFLKPDSGFGLHSIYRSDRDRAATATSKFVTIKYCNRLMEATHPSTVYADALDPFGKPLQDDITFRGATTISYACTA
jgi:hypothetical protein